jgi:ABC-type multidrug transport system ATPase subunit
MSVSKKHILKVKNVTKSFDDKQVLQGINFKIEPGTIVGIIGPNGAGKTTLFRILATLLRPDDGEFWIDGISGTKKYLDVRRKVGYCPDKLPKDWYVIGADYLDLFRRLYGVDQSKVEEVLELVDLLKDAHRPVAKYSSGMVKRISLARAILAGGQFLLFDEPTAGLDPDGQRLIQDIILKMDKTDKAVLISSHNLYEIQRVCDVIFAIENGHIKPVESVSDALQDGLVVIELILEKADDLLVEAILKEFPQMTLLSKSGARIRFRADGKLQKKDLFRFLMEKGGDLRELKFL